jgi:VWFA-related protein
MHAPGTIVLLAVTLAAALPARAQPQPPPPPPVFSSGTDIVNVTVSVTDKQGLPVSDVKQDEFVVYEDGRRQAIRLFGRGSDPEHSPAEHQLTLDLGMLFDTSESMLSQLRLSQEAAVRFLNC